MPKFTIYKSLLLKVEIDAETAQDAFGIQLEMNDNTFAVADCQYEVYDAAGSEVHVDMGG